jgi:lipopolysaccharide export system protein LptA
VRRFALVIAALLAGLLPALAETPVKVTADTFEVDDAHGLATFAGHVVVERDGMHLSADKLVVEYGPGGAKDIAGFTATGGVRINLEDQTATGETAVYAPGDETVTITGNVAVTNASGTVKGPKLVVDLKSNTSVFSGGSKGRVSGVFTPQ